MTIKEGAAFYGGPRNTGPSFRVDRVGTSFCVVSTPYPLHWAWVKRIHLTHLWRVTVGSTDGVRARTFPPGELTKALRHAGTIVGALYRVDMRSTFTPPQRFAMGRNQCPHRIPCPLGAECPRRVEDETGPHYHLCLKVPDNPRTVFCQEHTPTPDMPGDAFHAVNDSRGGG